MATGNTRSFIRRVPLVILIISLVYTGTAGGILPRAGSGNISGSGNIFGLSTLNIDKQTAIRVTTLIFSNVKIPNITMGIKSTLPISEYQVQWKLAPPSSLSQWDYSYDPAMDYVHEIDMGFFGKITAMENGMPLEVKAPWTANLERKMITLLKSRGHNFIPKLNLDILFLDFLMACVEKSKLCIHEGPNTYCPPDALGKFAIKLKENFLASRNPANSDFGAADIGMATTNLYNITEMSKMINIDAYVFKPAIPCMYLSTHLYQGNIQRLNKIIDIFLEKLLQGNQGNLKGYPRTTQGGLTGKTLEQEAPRLHSPSNQEVNRAMKYLLSH